MMLEHFPAASIKDIRTPDQIAQEAHIAALSAMNKTALLNLDMRLGEGTGAVDADSFGVGAKVAAAGEAVAAAAANEVTFRGDVVPDLEVRDPGPKFLDVSAELVTHGHGDRDGALGPGIPVVDVEVGATDGGFADADEDIHRSRFGPWDLFHPKSGFVLRLDQCTHLPFSKPGGGERR